MPPKALCCRAIFQHNFVAEHGREWNVAERMPSCLRAAFIFEVSEGRCLPCVCFQLGVSVLGYSCVQDFSFFQDTLRNVGGRVGKYRGDWVLSKRWLFTVDLNKLSINGLLKVL